MVGVKTWLVLAFLFASRNETTLRNSTLSVEQDGTRAMKQVEKGGSGQTRSPARPCSEAAQKYSWSFQFVAPILKGKYWKFSKVLVLKQLTLQDFSHTVCKRHRYERRQAIWRNSTFTPSINCYCTQSFDIDLVLTKPATTSSSWASTRTTWFSFDKVALNRRSDLQVSHLRTSYAIRCSSTSFYCSRS